MLPAQGVAAKGNVVAAAREEPGVRFTDNLCRYSITGVRFGHAALPAHTPLLKLNMP